MQMIASLRRLEYTAIVKQRDIHPDRVDPSSDLFDPERAAILHMRRGDYDEAIWLIFLSIHFGKNLKHGWRTLRDFYSGLGSGTWSWRQARNHPQMLSQWFVTNWRNIGGAFGNHRKYETLNPASRASTLSVIEGFLQACSPTPSAYFSTLAQRTGNDPATIFDAAYKELRIPRFGRLARFDFLALLGRLDLAPLRPGSTYLSGATGPLRGARLLVDGRPDSTTDAGYLEALLTRLDAILDIGMQPMEDAICNWQKSPDKFIHFKG